MAIYLLPKWRPAAILISTEVKFEVIFVKSVSETNSMNMCNSDRVMAAEVNFHKKYFRL